MYDMLKRKNEWMSPEVVEFAADLIRTPSPSYREDRVADKVEQEMKRIGYDRVVRDSSGNVVGLMLGREAGPTVALIAHMDTVGAGDEAKWTDMPYSGTVRDGRLLGLGASDCKAGVACGVHVGDLLKRSLLPLRGNLVVAATVAEENGCAVGVRTLIEKTLPELELEATYAILAEPSGLGLYYGHDGWLEMDVSVEGTNQFQVGDVANAIFDDLEKGQEDDSTPTLSVERPRFQSDRGMRRATIQINRRLTAGDEVRNVVGQIKHGASLVAQGMGSVALEVAVCEDVQQLYTGKTTLVRRVTHSWATDPFGPLMERSRQILSACGCQVRPGRWKLGRLGMGTAGGVLVNEYRVPTICYGPGDEAMAHAPNESVALDAIRECTYGTAAIVHGLIGVPVFGWADEEI